MTSINRDAGSHPAAIGHVQTRQCGGRLGPDYLPARDLSLLCAEIAAPIRDEHKQLLAPADEVEDGVSSPPKPLALARPRFINNPAMEPGAGRGVVVPPWQKDHAASRRRGAPTGYRAATS